MTEKYYKKGVENINKELNLYKIIKNIREFRMMKKNEK
jgi:hypothetical protein